MKRYIESSRPFPCSYDIPNKRGGTLLANGYPVKIIKGPSMITGEGYVFYIQGTSHGNSTARIVFDSQREAQEAGWPV